jgi:hypothetical protein
MTHSHPHTDDAPPRVVLARRTNSGLTVKLLWAEDTNTVAVLVHDRGTRGQFELAVEPDVNPLHVFEHPYAHAARRGVDYPADLRRAA